MPRPCILLLALLAIVLALVGCQAAPTATPTTAPTATKPPAPAATAPTATTAPAPAQPTAVTAPATPTKPPATPTPKGPTASGKVVLAFDNEPAGFDNQMFTSIEMRQTIRGTSEQLVERNPKTMQLIGTLAESWEQTSPTNWRFKLRKGVKFQDGYPWDADAAAFNINRATNKDLNPRTTSFYPQFKGAKKVDESTIDLELSDADPITPVRAWFLPIYSAKWMKENPEELAIKVVGTGPYKFVDYVKGQYARFTAYEDYWGDKPTIKDVTYLWRKEPSVRAAMVKTGEADFAWAVGADQAANVPQPKQAATVDVVFVRLNTVDNKVLQDKRVREAMNLAVDRKGIVDKILGGFGAVASQGVPEFAIGYNKDLKPTPYDVNKAKQLVKDAGAEGAKLEYVTTKGRFARDDELAEALTNMFNAAGLSTKVTMLDNVGWRDYMYGIAPDQKHSDLFQINSGNEAGDSSQTLEPWFRTKGQRSLTADAQVDKSMDDGRKSTNMDERAKLYGQAWARLSSEFLYVPIAHLGIVHGTSKRLTWEPRLDGQVMVKEMSLTQ